jgi:hypothetical protein
VLCISLSLPNFLFKKEVVFTFPTAIKKNEIMLFAGEWMELENIMLNEVSQTQKVKGCIFSLICGS